MPTTEVPDLSPAQLNELDDRMKAAKQERHRREAAERGKRQLIRQTQSKLTRVCGEFSKTNAELAVKQQTVLMLRERLEGFEEMNPNDSEVRAELAALEQALTWAMEQGVAIVAGVNCPTNARSARLLNDASPHGTNWRTPVAEFERQLGALAQERDRLQARLAELEDGDTGCLAA